MYRRVPVGKVRIPATYYCITFSAVLTSTARQGSRYARRKLSTVYKSDDTQWCLSQARVLPHHTKRYISALHPSTCCLLSQDSVYTQYSMHTLCFARTRTFMPETRSMQHAMHSTCASSIRAAAWACHACAASYASSHESLDAGAHKHAAGSPQRGQHSSHQPGVLIHAESAIAEGRDAVQHAAPLPQPSHAPLSQLLQPVHAPQKPGKSVQRVHNMRSGTLIILQYILSQATNLPMRMFYSPQEHAHTGVQGKRKAAWCNLRDSSACRQTSRKCSACQREAVP